jgi:hypothetical protein
MSSHCHTFEDGIDIGYRNVGSKNSDAGEIPRRIYDHTVTPWKMEPTLVTETSEVKTQKPGKFPEESTLDILIPYYIAFSNFIYFNSPKHSLLKLSFQ